MLREEIARRRVWCLFQIENSFEKVKLCWLASIIGLVQGNAIDALSLRPVVEA
jgi:hypothetical protein